MSWFKVNRIKDRKYLDWISTLPCLVTKEQDGTIVGHHLQKTGLGGMGMKSPDNFVVPLNFISHLMVHKMDETEFFLRHGIYNVKDLANEIYRLYKDKQYEAAKELVLRRGK